MKPQPCRPTVLAGHKENAVEVPFDPCVLWGSKPVQIRPERRGYAVVGEVNGYRFKSHVVARSKKFWLLLQARVVAEAKTRAGETIAVKLQPEYTQGVDGLLRAPRRATPAQIFAISGWQARMRARSQLI